MTDLNLMHTIGVTSAIQTQIDGKLSTSGGTLTGDLTIDKTSSTTVAYNTINSQTGQLASFRLQENSISKSSIVYDPVNSYAYWVNNASSDSIKLMDAGGVTINTDFKPATTETHDLGTASLEWDNIFLQNAATVSDLRRKSVLGDSLGLDFIKKLKPIEFTYNNTIKEAVTKEVTRQIQETEEQAITEKYIEIVDGQPIQKTRTKTVEIPLFDLVELKDEDGNTVLDDNSNPIVCKVPHMKTIIETVIVEPAINVTHGRPHSGFGAQEVEAVLNEIGKDNAVLAYDKDADKYHLRYMELIAPLCKAVQELSAKIDALENTV